MVVVKVKPYVDFGSSTYTTGPSLFGSIGLGARQVKERHRQTFQVGLVSFTLQHTSPSHTPICPSTGQQPPEQQRLMLGGILGIYHGLPCLGWLSCLPQHGSSRRNCYIPHWGTVLLCWPGAISLHLHWCLPKGRQGRDFLHDQWC